MSEIVLMHVRSLLYGAIIAFIIHYIVSLVDIRHVKKDKNARFVLNVSILGMAWLLLQYTIWFTVDALEIPYSDTYALMWGTLNFIEILTPPIFQFALYSIANLKRMRIRYMLLMIMPLVALCVIYLCTREGFFIELGYYYNMVLCIVMPIIVYIRVKHYEHLLRETYADVSYRGVKWVLSILYSMLSVFLAWLVLCLVAPSVMSDCIYMVVSIAVWGFYVNRLRMHNFNIKVMQEIDESGEAEIEPAQPAAHDVAKPAQSAVTELPQEPVKLKAWQEPHFDEAVRKFCNLEENFTNPDLSVQDVASGVGTNRTYVSRWCKEQGVDFSTFIIDIRLVFAEKQLADMGKSLIEISEMAGFSNPRHFRNMFVAKYGVTPSEYRQQYKS